LLDQGLEIFQWNGKQSGPMEKLKGAQLTKALQDERKGLPKIYILEEGKKTEEMAKFFKLLGGEGPIKTAEQGGSDKEAERQAYTTRRLFRLTDSSGQLEFKLEAEGENVTRNKFDSKDAFIFDTGSEVVAWVGSKASVQERNKSLRYAQEYLTKYNRPLYLPISRILEGGENEVFESYFV